MPIVTSSRPTSDGAIVLCADRRYFPAAYALCLSLSQSQQQDIYLLTEDCDDLRKAPANIPFNIMLPEFIHRLPDSPSLYEALPPFGYLRLLAPEIVSGYARILYLDTDIRIGGSLAPLFRIDMKGATLAAVDGFGSYCPTPIRSKAAELIRSRHALGMQPNDPYFNSGVLLIDTDKWKRHQVADACTKQLQGASRNDQDALNVVLQNSWLPLSLRWNCPCDVFETKIEGIIKPVVFHNLLKPWNFGEAIRREVTYFHQSLSATPYRDFLRSKPSLWELKRLVELRFKEGMQYATFYLPTSYQRLQHRNVRRMQREVARFLLANIQTHRLADIDQNISDIDVSALSALL